MRIETCIGELRHISLALVLSSAFIPGAWAVAQGNVPGFPGGQPGNPFLKGDDFFKQFFGGRNRAEDDELKKIEVTPREEQEYGEQVLQSMRDDLRRRKISLVSRGKEVDYLKKVVNDLRGAMKNRNRYASIRVLVADSDSSDAFSIPGGTLIVFRGMLEFADTEAALAGVLGHELSHLDHGHQLLPMKRMKLARQANQTRQFDPATFFRQANVFMSAFMKPFRPEDETEADEDGVTWSYLAGYDPRAMAILFARMNERDQAGQFMPSFLRTHPYHADRQAAVERLFAELQRTHPRDNLYLGRTNLRRLIPMSENRFPE